MVSFCLVNGPVGILLAGLFYVESFVYLWFLHTKRARGVIKKIMLFFGIKTKVEETKKEKISSQFQGSNILPPPLFPPQSTELKDVNFVLVYLGVQSLSSFENTGDGTLP